MKWLLIIYCAIYSRLGGWGKSPIQSTTAGLCYATAFGFLAHNWWEFVGFIAWSFAWTQTGYAPAYDMGTRPEIAESGRRAPLDRVLDIFKLDRGHPVYCWTFMGLKGLLIHAPLGLWALPAAVLYPFAYWIARYPVRQRFPKFDNEIVAESLAGGFTGLLIACAIS